MYCKNCGTNVLEGQSFCTNCGMTVNEGNGAAVQGKARLVDGTVGTQSKGKFREQLDKLNTKKNIKYIGIAGYILMLVSFWIPGFKLSRDGSIWGAISLKNLLTEFSGKLSTSMFAFMIIFIVLSAVLLLCNKTGLSKACYIISLLPQILCILRILFGGLDYRYGITVGWILEIIGIIVIWVAEIKVGDMTA